MLHTCLQGQVNTQAVEIKLIGALPTLAPTQVALCQPDGSGRIQNEDILGEDQERAGESLGKDEGGIRCSTKKMSISAPQGCSCNSAAEIWEQEGNRRRWRLDGQLCLFEWGWVGHSNLTVEAVGNSRCKPKPL